MPNHPIIANVSDSFSSKKKKTNEASKIYKVWE